MRYVFTVVSSPNRDVERVDRVFRSQNQIIGRKINSVKTSYMSSRIFVGQMTELAAARAALVVL